MARTKLILFVTITLVVVALDLGTKHWADRWLASPKTHPEFPDHPIRFTVHPGDEGKTIEQLLTDRLPWSRPEEIERMARRYTLVEGRQVAPDHVPKPGQTVTVLRRKVVVVPGHWTFKFVRNPSASWGLLGNVSPRYRRPLLLVLPALSMLLIVGLFWKSDPDQRLLHGALGMILGGAIGNLVDRIRFGYVVDFIDWFVRVGDKTYTWPTFNVADVAISVGVGLLVIEIFRQNRREAEAGAEDDPGQA